MQPAEVRHGEDGTVSVLDARLGRVAVERLVAAREKCKDCAEALALISKEGEAKDAEQLERHIRCLWKAAHGTKSGARRLTDGLEKDAGDRRGLLASLIARCSQAMSAGRTGIALNIAGTVSEFVRTVFLAQDRTTADQHPNRDDCDTLTRRFLTLGNSPRDRMRKFVILSEFLNRIEPGLLASEGIERKWQFVRDWCRRHTQALMRWPTVGDRMEGEGGFQTVAAPPDCWEALMRMRRAGITDDQRRQELIAYLLRHHLVARGDLDRHGEHLSSVETWRIEEYLIRKCLSQTTAERILRLYPAAKGVPTESRETYRRNLVNAARAVWIAFGDLPACPMLEFQILSMRDEEGKRVFCKDTAAGGTFHGIATCYRQIRSSRAPAQQCCYYKGGLLLLSREKGSLDLIGTAEDIEDDGDCNYRMTDFIAHINVDKYPNEGSGVSGHDFNYDLVRPSPGPELEFLGALLRH